jgi:hypothetical protein
MLNPHRLNNLSGSGQLPENDFPITWFSPEVDPTIWLQMMLTPDERAQGKVANFTKNLKKTLAKGRIPYNLGNRNIRAAWEGDNSLATKYPVGIYPTSIHPRITVQKSTFTIWGSDKRGLAEMVEEIVDAHIVCKFVIEDSAIKTLIKDLQFLGITRSSLFPDLDNLAKDLTDLF